MHLNLFLSHLYVTIFAYIPNGDAYGLISLIIGGIAGAGALAYFIFGDGDKGRLVKAALVIFFIGGVGIYGWLHFFNQPPVTHQWATALQEFAPACGTNDNSSGNATWQDDSTTLNQTKFAPVSCSASGLSMQRTNTNQLGAEEDLDQLNGGVYSQTQFRAQVTVQFQTNLDDANTTAGLIVQTPISGTGGFLFDLNNTGYWELKQVQASSEPVIDNGSVSINLNQTIILEVDVQNGVLSGSINGQNVVTYNDTLDASSTIAGLVVEWNTTNAEAPVRFTDFKLDQWQ